MHCTDTTTLRNYVYYISRQFSRGILQTKRFPPSVSASFAAGQTVVN